MRIDITSMFFNSKIEGQTATPAWGTSIGQNKSRECRIDDFKPEIVNLIIGMTYKSVSDIDNLDISKGSAERETMICSVFTDIYVNNKRLDDAQYVLLLVREHSKSHDGRLIVSYAPYIKYKGFANQECIDLMRQSLGCSSEGCWFVYDISIENQSKLHFKAVVVNPTAPMIYSNSIKSKNRSEEWKALIPTISQTEQLSKYSSDQPHQQIFYGAPGTGKSHTINRDTKGHKTFRTTFHPDSDYSTFVGAYKPVMEEVETRVVPVVLNNGASFDQNKGTLKEKKISYRFVKQAFMKAYIAAWREFTNYSNVTLTSQAPQSISLTYNNQTWILTEVDDDRVLYTKEEIISIDEYKKNVLTYWLTMPEPDEKTGKLKLGTFDHYQAAGCVWYRKKQGKDHSAEECWEAIKNVLEAGGTIEATPNSQTYSISLRDDVIVAVTRDNKATKKAVKGCFENTEADSSVQKRIAKELKEFNADDFDKAWEELKKVVNGVEVLESTNTIELSPVFLIIEEINRGNCAQIFGDLFQLLDRKEGFSQYPIHADEDVRKCLRSEHTDEDPSFGIEGLDLSPEQASYINSVLDCDDDMAEKIARGEVLVLPPNLYIWATMNTSDQSLFPIDSAFKRRWEWKYVKIKNHPEENYQIKLSDTDKRDWWEFVKQVNRIIASMTSSADKQLGYFFCKADGEGIISADKFVSKVLFYLWNDVFKDYGFEDASLFRYADATDPTKTHELTFPDFYDEEGEKVNIERVADFIGKVMAWDDNQKQG